MTINYYLDKPKAEAETAIYLFARHGKQTIKVKTGDYIHPKHWNLKPNAKDNHVKGSYIGAPELNDHLLQLKRDVKNAYNDRIRKNPVFNFPDFRDDILALLHPTEVKPELSLMERFEEYIQTNSAHRSDSTLRKYRGIYNHLANFSKEKKYKLSFESIDMKFFDAMKDYLVKDLKHTDNTIWKTFATLKSFLNWAVERGYHQNLTFKKFKAPQSDVDIIYLTEKELLDLYYADLSAHPRLDRVRDVFCFGCFTGKRYAELAKLKRSDIKGTNWLLRTAKTDSINQVPLNPYALTILKKYKDNPKPLPVSSNQKTNEYIKELCKLVGINELTSLYKKRGNEKLLVVKPKYEFIGTHTARRTFITLSLEKGMRPEVVMRITEHTNYQTFKKYIKISDKVKEVEMNNIWQITPKKEAIS